MRGLNAVKFRFPRRVCSRSSSLSLLLSPVSSPFFFLLSSSLFAFFFSLSGERLFLLSRAREGEESRWISLICSRFDRLVLCRSLLLVFLASSGCFFERFCLGSSILIQFLNRLRAIGRGISSDFSHLIQI